MEHRGDAGNAAGGWLAAASANLGLMVSEMLHHELCQAAPCCSTSQQLHSLCCHGSTPWAGCHPRALLHSDTEAETNALAELTAPSGFFDSVSQESNRARDPGSALGRGSQTTTRGMPQCSISTGSCVDEDVSDGKRL